MNPDKRRSASSCQANFFTSVQMEYFNSENAVYDFLQRSSKLMQIGILLVFVLLIFAVIWDYLFQKPLDIRGCHVLITG